MSEKVALNAVRRSGRYRVALDIPVRLATRDATLIDVSSATAFVTHAGALKSGSVLDLVFDYQGRHFAGRVRVNSCGVVGLGAAKAGATLYGSRLGFLELTPESRDLIEDIIASSLTGIYLA